MKNIRKGGLAGIILALAIFAINNFGATDVATTTNNTTETIVNTTTEVNVENVQVETNDEAAITVDGEIPAYVRDEWNDRKANSFYDPIRDKTVGMRNYQLYLATNVDITDQEQFSYTCWYCGKESNNYNDFDWDHLVPLAYAHNAGGYAWTHEEKVAYAHDPEVGINVCAHCNRQKGADGPCDWLPENNQREYCERFVEICEKYNLTIDEESMIVIQEILK